MTERPLRIDRNADNDATLPLLPNQCATGYVEEEEEIPFMPTRHELLQLAVYWVRHVLDIEWSVFLLGQWAIGSSSIRAFAFRRIDRIAEVLGEDAVSKVIETTRSEFGQECDPRYWRIATEATPEEKEALREEIRASMDEEDDIRFHAELLKFLAGEPCDIRDGTGEMEWAELAREWVKEDPALGLPSSRDVLLARIKEVEERRWQQVQKEQMAANESVDDGGCQGA
jgi:hypothetical protein